MGHVLVWTGCSSAPQGHSVKDRVNFLSFYCAEYSPSFTTTLIHTLVGTAHSLLEQVTQTSHLMDTPIQCF